MRRILSTLLIVAILSGFVPSVEIAKALDILDSVSSEEIRPGGGLEEIREVNSVETRYGLVAVLVNESLWENEETYQGLQSTFSFGDKQLSQRIQRYAEDLQATIPWTKTMIVKVKDDSDPVEIQNVLERLYFEGNPNDSDYTKLSGIVIVGDVALPVVNKNGYKFLSLLPYTDFEDPSYTFDSTSGDFLRNSLSENLQADVWHGLIVPPLDGEDGNELLAQFFDKNHFFHDGDADYTSFDKKSFVGDLVTEEATINEVSFDAYQRFIKYWEEIAYYRYTNTWLEKIHNDMQTSVEAGDLLDNDLDGVYDEEAANGEDEDGDGLIDEDIGDGFYLIDNDEDGLTDEDNYADNNNDANKTLYPDDADLPYAYDRVPDEDPPGDANGDGCPGVCGMDDNGNGVDHDEDGFPTGMEIKKWNDARFPWASPKKVARGYFNLSGIDSDEDATEAFTEWFTDDDYEFLVDLGLVEYVDSSCYLGSVYHNEWDDDEDGFCDEDGSTELMSNGCAYNDADCDGKIDEDPAGLEPVGLFESLPDIQSKKLIDNLLKRYAQIFEKPTGVWNRLVNGSGRYKTRYQDEDGNPHNDYDSTISLIATRDEAVLQYLRNVNNHFESRLNEMVKDLQKDIPVIASLKMYGTLSTEDGTKEFCDKSNPGNASSYSSGGCLQFVNHTMNANSHENVDTTTLGDFFVNGMELKDISNVKQCSNFDGSYEEDGRYVEKTGLFSRETANITSKSDQKSLAGCFIGNASNYLLGDPFYEVCFPAIATDPIGYETGAKIVNDDEGNEAFHPEVTDIEQGYPACYEFRELDTYQIYHKVTDNFNDWLVNKMRKDETGELTAEEWLATIEEKAIEVGPPTAGTATLRKHFDELYLLDSDGFKYSLTDLLKDAGYELEENSYIQNEYVDFILAERTVINVNNPTSGSGMEDIEKIQVELERQYLNEDKNGLTHDESKAFRMSSVYYFTEPDDETLNAQIRDGAVPNLPIDKTRRVTFRDNAEKYISLDYLNIFGAGNVGDFEEQITNLAEGMAEVSSGDDYADEILDFMNDFSEEELEELEAAFGWRDMNIDEKHKYVFENNFGAEEATREGGYEIAAIISKGDAQHMYFAFNGDKPSAETDLEWLYGSEEGIEEALSEEDPEEAYDASTDTGMTPVPLTKWISEMEQWIKETENSLSSHDQKPEFACGEKPDLGASSDNKDGDANGIPDLADETASINLSSEDNNVLQANGLDHYTVTVSARKSDGSVNTDDNYSEIELQITSGTSSIEISGNNNLQLTAGVATFVLKSKDEGSFTVQGKILNRSDISNTNSLSGTVTEKFVKVSSYVLGEEDLKKFTDKVPADGESFIYVQAEIRDQEDNIYNDDNSSVIEFTLSESGHGALDREQVQVKNGEASTIFTASTSAGEIQVEANIVDTNLPTVVSGLSVYAGEPVSVEIRAESSILPAGGEALNDITVNLYDQFGNLANNGYYQVTIESELEALDLSDENGDLEGYQVTTVEGFVNFRVKSALNEGDGVIKASLSNNTETETAVNIKSIEGMTLQIGPEQPYLTAGSSGNSVINVTAVDATGTLISGFQGDVNLSISDDNYGTFEATRLSLGGGEAQGKLSAGTLAGLATITAQSADIESASINFEFKPADPYELRIRKDDGTNIVKAGERENFYVESFDQYGNLVNNDGSTFVNLRITDLTEDFGQLSATGVTLNQGSKNFYVDIAEISGKLNLVASAENLIAGSYEGEIDYFMSSEEFKNINPQILYSSFLGGAYGDVTQESYIGGWLTFNGKTQATSTLISDPLPKKVVASIDGSGKIIIPATSILSQTLSGATNKIPMRATWRSFPEDLMQGEIIFVFPNDKNYASANLINTSSVYKIEEQSDGYILRENEEGVVKIRGDGQVEILNENYYLGIAAASDGLSIVVSKNTSQVMRINYENAWASDVSLLDSDFDFEDWQSLDAGIYIRPSAATENYFRAMPTGHSSKNASGLALIDPEEDLPEEMQPSLGYDSLDKAALNGDIGWEGENKNLLLFAAGNTAGDSNLFYASEVGVLLGDPSAKLVNKNELNEAGFTDDIGKMVYANEDEILSLLNVDYNGDELEDILIAYENGKIDVLQNNKSPNRFNNRGTILNLENGISSIDKGDFNSDGLDDLLVVTKESCMADEMCLYYFENIDGGFVSNNLTFESIKAKPKQVEVADLNNDEFSDLVILDENLELYVIWNEDGIFEDANVEELKDFGLHIEEGDDLSEDIALRFSDLESSSLSLVIPRDGFKEESSTDFINGVLADDDFESVTGKIESQENADFEYAPDLSEYFDVSKKLSDDNGGALSVGDAVTVSINVKNISSQNLKDIYISDSVSGSFDFDLDKDVFNKTDNTFRPFTYGPFDLNNAATKTLTYKMTLKFLPNVQIMLGNDFYSDYKDDNYIDIALSPEGNDTGTLIVFYSDGTRTEGSSSFLGRNFKKVNYFEKDYTKEEYADEYEQPVESEISDTIQDANGNGQPDAFEDMNAKKGVKVSEDNKYFMEDIMGAKDVDGDGYYGADEYFTDSEDSDNDGLIDQIDNWQNSDASVEDQIEGSIAKLDGLVTESANAIEKIISIFTCNGGCISVPSNIAFLAPGEFHEPFTGKNLGKDPFSMPIFGIMPLPAPPVVCFGKACENSQIFRLYLAPTTTLGLGLGLCVGPYGSPTNCYAFNLPILQLIGFCDTVNNFIADNLSKATSFSADSSSNGESKIFNVNVSGSKGGGGVASDAIDGYAPPVIVNKNVQVPGFPDVLTEWWKKQKLEFTKMLDLPDIIFIYPDPKSIKQAFTNLNKDPVLEIETNILGLEKFLNWAHSLPIVDVEIEKVYFEYPWMTKEEIELTKLDFENWLKDTKAKRDKFLADFADILSPEDYATLSLKFDALISGIENNLAVLDSYAEIPEQILKIREIQAYYAKVIICYLDAILQYFGGYLNENASRVDAWAKWSKDLKKIVGTWTALFKVSADLMKSCDKCTNQRYSSFQLLAQLFTFIPDLPVIELPKLPDIIIDTSHVQAGVDIKWPNIDFRPKSLDIPKIPRITLPSVDLDIDIEIDFASLLKLTIPVLPEFKLDVEIPELPGLPLPDLPKLPPPPELPEISGSLSGSLKIVSSVIRIICLIRQGFIPVNETSLKTKIEEMTERPGLILPMDLGVTTSFGKFNFDFLKNIQIDTYLNLVGDFDVLFDFVNGIAENEREAIDKFVNELNEGASNVSEDLEDTTDEITDHEAEVEIETYNPANEIALQYVNEPLVQASIGSLQNSLKKLQEKINEWDVGENVRLEAGQRILALDDPLLNRYAEIEKHSSLDSKLIASIKDSPLAALAELRSALIAKVDSIEKGSKILKDGSEENFYKYLAMENASEKFTFANTGPSSISSLEGLEFNAEEPEDIEFNFAEEEASTEPVSYDEGLYIYNEELGIGQKLISYSAEADEAISTLFMDIDSDGDQDIIYSLGGDVYIKENHTEEANLKYLDSGADEMTIAELRPVAANPKNLKHSNNKNEQSAFTFSSSEGAIGYDISLYDSLDAVETAKDENIKRLLLLAETENHLIKIGENGTSADIPTGMETYLPEIKKSKLYVSDESGSNKLYNAFERTLVQANGELSTSDAVILQTIEDSQIKIRVGGETIVINVPAYTGLEFGRNDERVIRLESGSAYLMTGNTLYEQDLQSGMEIFEDEQINLESSSAKVVLNTSEGVSLQLDNEELFIMEKLANPENPSSQVDIENGAYYVTSKAIYVDGNSTVSDNILLNPQICADQSDPYPVINETEVDVPIFLTHSLDAENSFDGESEIVDAYWDLDDTVDADGDGILNNDEELIGLTVEIGPYEDIGQKTATLWVVDTAGNTASATVLINVYVPDIIINSATTVEVEGTTDPLTGEFPFHLVRDRNGSIAEIGDGYLTDEEGNWIVSDFENTNLLNVYNSEGEEIAQFNPETKQLLVYDSRYEATALAATAEWPSRIVVDEISSGQILASFIIVGNGDKVTISGSELENVNLSIHENPVVYKISDEENYAETEDGFAIQNEFETNQFLVKKNGNISVYDSSFELKKRNADSLDEYLILELYDEGELVLEIYPGSITDVTITTTDALDLPASGSVYETNNSDIVFEDIEEDDPLYDEIYDLVDKGVLQGYEINGKYYFKPTQAITRAEFTKIILAILCIIPREEAYDLPKVFNDILDNNLWYFPYTKESFIRDLITGYLGETDVNGLTPFKPNKNINTAEAAKIMLEALDKTEIIELPENLTGAAWYDPYMIIAQDLTDYMLKETTGGDANYILTEEEAADPSHTVTRYEFVEMSIRVLQAYNCFDYQEPEETKDLGLEPGIYAVQEPCITCPCLATIDYDLETRIGDIVYAIIQNEEGKVFGISNKVELLE